MWRTTRFLSDLNSNSAYSRTPHKGDYAELCIIATPYSDPDTAVRQQRFDAACVAAAKLMCEGHTVFSPVVQGHPLVAHGLPTDWSFWERYDRAHLERCDEVVVLMLDGWEQSVGVQAELRHAGVLGKPVWYMAAGYVSTPTIAHEAEVVRL